MQCINLIPGSRRGYYYSVKMESFPITTVTLSAHIR